MPRFAANTVALEGSKRCSKCRCDKPLSGFYTTGSWCKACQRLGNAIRRRTDAHQAWCYEYNRRPDVQEKQRQWRLKQAEKQKAADRRWRKSPRGKLMRARTEARYHLKHAKTPQSKAHYEARIKMLDREIKRQSTRKDKS